jgi:hypothetical protein
MGSTELATALQRAGVLLIALTGLGTAAGALIPGLAGTTRPHPTLTGSTSDALGILASNIRVLAAPFLLWLLRVHSSRLRRASGDVIVLALAGVSAVTVGIALGRWRERLIPYLPHLPLEWAALIVAIAAWLLIRTGSASPRQLLALACSVVMLLCAAAAVETFATPHRQVSSPNRADADHRSPQEVGWLLGPCDLAGAPVSGMAVPACARRRIDGPTSTTDP